MEEVGDAPLRARLDTHLGWPVMTGDEWDNDDEDEEDEEDTQHQGTGSRHWTLEEALGRLVANFTKRVLIDMMVTTDDKNSSARVIQVRQLKVITKVKLMINFKDKNNKVKVKSKNEVNVNRRMRPRPKVERRSSSR